MTIGDDLLKTFDAHPAEAAVVAVCALLFVALAATGIAWAVKAARARKKAAADQRPGLAKAGAPAWTMIGPLWRLCWPPMACGPRSVVWVCRCR